MKRYCITLLSVILAALAMQAQTVIWKTPHVGYTNNKCLTIEKISFGKSSTEVQAVITADVYNSFILSSDTKLKSGSDEARIVKVSKLKLDKEYIMPDSGKVHVVMSFAPFASVPDKLHFIEEENGRGWKLCNIRPADKAIDSSAEYWDDEAYANNPDLPYTFFNTDSTTVNVKILNYTPEAGRTVNFSYEKLDVGHLVLREAYPIAEDGTVTIKFHPCFPITAYMSIGNSVPLAYILLVPGKDVSILMDWENADDGFGMKSFKGAYARLHYQVNVMGGKDFIPYVSPIHKFEAVLRNQPGFELLRAFESEKYSIQNAIRDASFSQNKKEAFSEATVDFLTILNDNSYLTRLYLFSEYLCDEMVKVVKPISYDGNIVRYMFNKDVVGGKMTEEEHILLGDRMTICPLFSTILSNNPHTDVWTRGDAVYNKSVLSLRIAILNFRSGNLKRADEEAKDIVIPELKAYYKTIVGRMKL